MSENKYCGNCKFFKDEDAVGWGRCVGHMTEFGVHCSQTGCLVHKFVKNAINGWTEISKIMKQEYKDLLLKDLCSRLPYGIKIKTSYDKMDEPIELIFINPRNESFAIGSNFTLISGLDFDTYECKPYLFPFSSMTDEQKEEYNQSRLKDLRMLNSALMERTSEGNNFDRLVVAYNETDWLNKNHFDYRGLIEKGLAIDATGLNIYKEETK